MAEEAPRHRETVTTRQHARTIDGGTRALLLAFGVLTSLAVATMYVLAEHTDRYFAWTVSPPLTAAFLGAGYGAGLAAVVVSLWRGGLAPVRIGLQVIFVFVVATTVATLMHLEPFHFDAGGIAQAAAWVWLAIYLAVPVWMAVVLWRIRAPESAHGSPALPAAARVLLAVMGLLFAGVGAAMFLAPSSAQVLWAWELSPLTARAVAAWLFALAVAALLAIRERDAGTLEVPAAISLTVALLYAGGLMRFPDQVVWSRPAASLLVLLIAVVAATGAVGFAYARRARTGGPYAVRPADDGRSS